jgi:eukaryotic-like serine/threonine-protein kinase
MLSTNQIIDGKYRIVRLLGEGGMGAVYEGYHELIRRRVALKVLHSAVSENLDAAARFEREAQAAGRIGSPHIVEVLDLGFLDSGARYMVMEFLEGESLKDRLARCGKPPLPALLQLQYQLLDGIGAAHAAGIIHRDLKPDNVYLQRRAGNLDFIKLLDFGISKFTELNLPGGLTMTSTGAVMGTPMYMSPEQARGSKQVDHRTDVYAAGVMLYECLTGRVPFTAASFNELMFKIALEDAPPIRQSVPDVHPELAAIVERAMARDPERRFSSAAELRRTLEAWADAHVAPASPETSPAWPLARAATPSGMPSALGAPSTASGTHRSWETGQSGIEVGGAARSRTPLWAGIGAGVVALALVTAYFVRGAETKGTRPGELRAPTETAASALTPAVPTSAAVAPARPNGPVIRPIALSAVQPDQQDAPRTPSTPPDAKPGPTSRFSANAPARDEPDPALPVEAGSELPEHAARARQPPRLASKAAIKRNAQGKKSGASTADDAALANPAVTTRRLGERRIRSEL